MLKYLKWRQLKRHPLNRALLLAQTSMMLVFAYTDNAQHPLPKEDLERIANIMKTYHRNFISAEYVHRHQCIRAEAFERIEPMDYRFQ